VILIKRIAIKGIIKEFIVRLMSKWFLRDSSANLIIDWMSDTLLIFDQNLIRIPAWSSDLLKAILKIIRTRINFRFIVFQHWSVISTQTHDCKYANCHEYTEKTTMDPCHMVWEYINFVFFTLNFLFHLYRTLP
jgi:hypothetical protein